MRFAAPGYLWLIAALPLFAGLFALDLRRRRRALETFGDLPLVRRLAPGASLERRIIKAALVVAAALFLALAAARPQWGARAEEVRRSGIDVILAVDVSPSMLAEDTRPRRLDQARAAVLSFLDLLEGDRVGLVAFSGAAYVACPLTLDYSAAALFVDILDPELIPVRGTAIADALGTATAAFRKEDRRHKVIVLITDGEDHEGDVEAAARDAAAAGVVIHAVGIGGPAGEPIPLRDGRGDVVGYKEDAEHRKVTTRLDEATLQAIAAATGGRYFRSTPEGLELHKVYEEIARMDQKTTSGRLVTTYEERYQFPLGAAILLLVLEAAIPARRRSAAAAGAASRTAA